MKIKENIKKIGNRKNCLLLALLILALLFTILMPKINIGTQKASAATTRENPFGGYYTVNNYRFEYQTSLNALKRNGIFNREIQTDVFMLQEDTEGLTQLTVKGNMSIDNTNYTLFNDIFAFYQNDEIVPYNVTNYRTAVGSDELFIDIEDNSGNPNETNTFINGRNNNVIKINLKTFSDKLNEISTGYNDFLTACFQIQFAYVSNEYNSSNDNDDYLFDNTIFYNYYISSPIDYTYQIKHINGYQLRAISIFISDSDANQNFSIKTRRMDGFYNLETSSFAINTEMTYNNIDIYQDPTETAYVIGLTPIYLRDNTGGNSLPIYSGNYRMEYNYSSGALGDIFETNTYENISGIEFGFVEPTPLITKIRQQQTNLGYNFQATDANNNNYNLFNHFNSPTLPTDNNVFIKDYSIMNVVTPQSFNKAYYFNTATGETALNFSLLENSIADKYTGVTFLGYEDTEQDKFLNQFKGDMINLLNFALDGAIAGALIGLIFGNPLAGALIGAGIGGSVALLPLIGDLFNAIGINNNIGGWIRNNLAPNIPAFIPNRYSPTQNNTALGLPLWAIVIIVGLIALFVYLFFGV